MSQRRHGIARVRIGNLPRPKSVAPIATIAGLTNLATAAKATPLEKLQRQGNRAFTRWLATPGAIRLDGRGERAADALAEGLRTGRAAGRDWHSPAAVSGADLKPRVQGLVRSVISTRGMALPARFRARAEAHVGETLEGIQVHTDSLAAEAADALNARAFAFGPHLIFGAGEYAPHSPAGEVLLAHELAHALLQRSVGAAVVQRWDREHPSPFEPVLAEFDTNIQLLQEFIVELDAVTNQSTEFARELRNLHTALDDITAERTATRYLSDEAGSPLARGRGGGTEERRPSVVPEGSGVDQGVYDALRTIYYGPSGVVTRTPSSHSLGIRRGQLERGVTLIQSLRVAVLNLITDLSAEASAAQREVTLDVASYYLQCATLLEPDALAQIGFLDAFYADPSVVMLYAAVREGARVLPDIIANESNFTNWRARLESAAQSRGLPLAQSLDRAERMRVLLEQEVSRFGDPPRRAQAAHEIPELHDAIWFGAQLRFFAVAQSVLALWLSLEYVSEMLGDSLYAGTSLWPGEDDRDRWQRESEALRVAFTDEIEGAMNPAAGYVGRIEAWEPRVQRLVEGIPSAVRTRVIMASIVEQIPFLLVSGGIAGGVGRFVSALTQGSRWLIAIAEGVTLTVLSAAVLPDSMLPTSAGGWATMLVLNIGWARVGRALFEYGGAVARGMSSTRGAIARASVEIVLPTASMAALQTAVQLIEAQAMGAGGETNVTEALTVNLTMNALGVMCGAAMNGHMINGRMPTAIELARSAGIDEAAAQRWIDMALRSAAYRAEVLRLNELAQRGTLSAEEFEAMKARGRALADEMEATLPGLSETLGLGHAPGEISAAIAAFRARLAALTYSASPTVTARLPELTAGVTRVNATTFVYDAARPPARLAELRAALAERYTVRERPGGGFEATNAEGRIVVLMLPAGPSSLAALPMSLDAVATGPQAQEGLTRARAQTAAPMLAPLLASAGAANGAATRRLLQVVGRTIEASDALPWQGLANYLNNGGDIVYIARGIGHHNSRAEPEMARERAQVILSEIAAWDASAVRGLGALYRVRPRTTGEQLFRLFADFPADQTEGIFQTLDVLEPISRNLGSVVGQLTSLLPPQQRGAQGVLTAAIQLAERYPGHILSFEVEVLDETGRTIRVQDISVIERTSETVAGVTTLGERTLATYEIKEISVASLGRRGRHQFAVDMLLDSLARSTRVVPVGASRPFFETFRWRIRRDELAVRAMRNLGTTDAADPRIEPELRRIVEGMLVRGFEDPVLNSMSADERAGYRAAFAGVPFVEFF